MRTLAFIVGVHALLRRAPKEELAKARPKDEAPGFLGGHALLRQPKEAPPTEAGPEGSGGESGDPAIIADGFSRFACLSDDSPAAVRIPYDDGNMRRPQMSPTECFTFCRDKAGMRFFLIGHGRDCYCTEYIHDVTTGGGNCDLPCEGDYDEMCGGKVKASAFEMHMCGKSASRADAAAASAREEAAKAEEAATRGNTAHEAYEKLSTQWQLGVCSKSAQVCDLAVHWEDAAQEVRDAAHRAEAAAEAAHKAADAVDAAKAAGFETAELATALEGAIDVANEDMRGAAVKGEVVTMALRTLAGPLGQVPHVEDFDELFHTASTREEWHAVCNLEPQEGMKYVMEKNGTTGLGLCGDVCVAAGDDCVGFNFQEVSSGESGAVACQMLSKTGVFTPEGSLASAFGTFEISMTKVGDMGYDQIDCFMKAAFLAGGKKPEVLATVITT